MIRSLTRKPSIIKKRRRVTIRTLLALVRTTRSQLRVAWTTWTTVHPLIVRYAPRKPCSCEQTYMPLGRRFRSGTQSYLHHHAIVCIVYFARIEHQASLLLHPVSNRLAEDRNISTAKPPLQSTSNAAKEKKNN